MDGGTPLVKAFGRTLTLPNPVDSNDGDDFTFVQLADPQLGLQERYIEKKSDPSCWEGELNSFMKAIQLVGKLRPKPRFIVICGDLIDAQPLEAKYVKYRSAQTSDLLTALTIVQVDIPVIVLPGNHDVGDKPTPESVLDYCTTWGDDYYSFTHGGVYFIVTNTQFWASPSGCQALVEKHDAWLKTELEKARESSSERVIVFQHIPFFLDNADEADTYFVVPNSVRLPWLRKMHTAGVRHVFAGHLHRNCQAEWTPEAVSMATHDAASSLHVVVSSSTAVQLGADKPGLRLIHVAKATGISHGYFALDDLEAMLTRGDQPRLNG